MKCNYKPPKLTKEEQQDMASMKSTLPYIDRLQIQHRNSESIENWKEDGMANRDKLIKLISQADDRVLSVPYIGEDGAEALADYLLENDVAPVIHGEWKYYTIGVTSYRECSVCGENNPSGFKTPYCPWCGAKMDGGN